MMVIQFPKCQEVWIHYKGGEYKIGGYSYNRSGKLEVIYYDSKQTYNQPLDTFLEVIDVPDYSVASMDGKLVYKKMPRFKRG